MANFGMGTKIFLVFIIFVAVLTALGINIDELQFGTQAIITTDVECVPATCCHATACVPASQAPDCSGIFCTSSCDGPLDCSAGECRWNAVEQTCVITPSTCGDGTCDSTEPFSITLGMTSPFAIDRVVKERDGDKPPAGDECAIGQSQESDCSDGSSITTKICKNGYWIATGNECPDVTPDPTPNGDTTFGVVEESELNCPEDCFTAECLSTDVIKVTCEDGTEVIECTCSDGLWDCVTGPCEGHEIECETDEDCIMPGSTGKCIDGKCEMLPEPEEEEEEEELPPPLEPLTGITGVESAIVGISIVVTLIVAFRWAKLRKY